jgi:hypothetical protein
MCRDNLLAFVSKEVFTETKRACDIEAPKQLRRWIEDISEYWFDASLKRVGASNRPLKGVSGTVEDASFGPAASEMDRVGTVTTSNLDDPQTLEGPVASLHEPFYLLPARRPLLVEQ